MRPDRRLATLAAIAASICAALPVAAQAQAFPNRPITIVVPASPGGAIDKALASPDVREKRAAAGIEPGAARRSSSAASSRAR